MSALCSQGSNALGVATLTAERLLLGVGPLVTVKRGVVRELLGAEIAAVPGSPEGCVRLCATP